MTILLLLLGIALFIGLVLIHEWGHFIVAKRNGVEVEEFGLGFPPKVKTLTKRNGTEYTLNLLPLGGFVRLKGEHDMDKSKGAFGAASLAVKIKIMLAGVAMNLITAVALLTFLALIGMPRLVENQFTVASDTKIVRDVENKGVVTAGEVEAGSPAAAAGLQTDDVIVSLDGTAISAPLILMEQTQAHAGQTVQLVYEQNGQNIEKAVTLNQTSPYLGVAPVSAEAGVQIRRSTWSAPVVAVGLTGQFTRLTFEGLGKALQGVGSIIAGAVTGNSEARRQGQSAASSQVSGIVGIMFILKEGSILGIQFILMIVAIISLTLAIMNVLPIPALDGGRLFVTLLFKALRKPLTPALEERIHGTGFAVLMGLFVLITIVDVKRFF